MTDLTIILIVIGSLGLLSIIVFAAIQISDTLLDNRRLDRRLEEDRAFINSQFFKATGDILRETARHWYSDRKSR